MTKVELEKENERLREELKSAKNITVTNCDISMKDQKAVAIARAVEEGMKALQSIAEGDSYGIYIES